MVHIKPSHRVFVAETEHVAIGISPRPVAAILTVGIHYWNSWVHGYCSLNHATVGKVILDIHATTIEIDFQVTVKE